MLAYTTQILCLAISNFYTAAIVEKALTVFMPKVLNKYFFFIL